ncbi:MAG: phage repressor protein [Coprococcus eutactus]|nr:phage repressor protein [Coprococcus eutactus]
MNDLKIYENKEFGEIRTVNIDGEPWFVGVDIATALGYSNTRDAIAKHIDNEDKATVAIHDGRQKRNITAINESGLYSLILSSELPSAKAFKRWVTSEVLPSIRKTGSYQKPLTPQEMMRIQLGMIDDVSDRVTKLENTMTIDYSQQKTLTNLMSSTVVTWLGGKNTCAYEELSKKVFAEIGRDYKDYFNVNARANTPSLRFEEAVDYIKSWKPSTNTLKLISSLNI